MELNAEVSWNVFNALPGPILALDDARKIVFANRAAFNLLGDTIEGEDRTVDVHIRRLRQALNKGGETGIIRTIRGSGYALDINPA